ncbi:MAG: hypothetical protein A2X49_10010 [Lentisphaerae bacterium GWF2_52_8]|nr:MAG: hypothetical protein A2X49_10010 [Lentisphaerae bacterium GWF2_52_8]
MTNFFHIARNTFRECLREPIFFLLLLSAIFMIGFFPSMALFVFREQIKLVMDSSMATTMVFGLATAVLCASHTVSREMRNGTVLLLLSKPVHRWSFILAKICGIIGALTVFVFICDTATLISLRVAKDQFQLDFTALYIYYGMIFLSAFIGAARNYLYRTSFASAACLSLCVLLPLLAIYVYVQPPTDESLPPFSLLWPALLLLFFAIWGMGAITVTLSTRLDMVPNLVICMLIFMGGLVSNYFLGKASETSFLGAALYAALPNWQLFWLADALANNLTIPVTYVLWAALYIVLYIGFCSVWAVIFFQNREVAQDLK